MARKDDILKSFLTHQLLESKYELNKEELPSTIREALNSDIPIIKAIALIVEGLDGYSPTMPYTFPLARLRLTFFKTRFCP